MGEMHIFLSSPFSFRFISSKTSFFKQFKTNDYQSGTVDRKKKTCNSLNGTISTSDELGLLQMVLELDTG